MKTLFTITLCVCMTTVVAQQNAADLALQFLNNLSAEQKKKAGYSFLDDERYDWHYIPKQRNGIPLREMNESQKASAFALMRACLSTEAYNKATEIIQLETVLKALENRSTGDDFRDPGKYYFTIFGTPAKKETWGWRLDGHHLSFSFSVDDNKLVSGTPGFMGSNPAVVPEGPQKGKEILKAETEKGFELLNAFSGTEREKLIFTATAPADIVTLVNRKALITEPQGVAYGQMTTGQQKLLLDLLSIYIHRYTKLFADEMFNEIRTAGLNELRFAWAGAQRPGTGNGYYYRITGPTIIIEYDNTQNNANHIHTVVRDLKHDFGGDQLLEHYRAEHKK